MNTKYLKRPSTLGATRVGLFVLILTAAGIARAQGRSADDRDFSIRLEPTKVDFTEIACRTFAYWSERLLHNSFVSDVRTCRGGTLNVSTSSNSHDPIQKALLDLAKGLQQTPSARTRSDCSGAFASSPDAPEKSVAPPPDTSPGGSNPFPDPDLRPLIIGVQASIETLFLAGRTAIDFETMVLDSTRRSACVRTAKAFAELAGAQLGPLADAIDKERSSARATDLFRKAETLATAGSGGNALVEIAGSPDRIAIAIAGALGADEKRDGNRLVLTANLASLVAASDSDRLRLSPFLRGIFFRTMLPLKNTSGVAGMDGNPNGSRMTVQIGGSMLDSSDPRLPEHNHCYLAALGYVPVYGTVKNAEKDAEERKVYLDVCHKLAASRHKLAWRFGIGFLTDAAATPGNNPGDGVRTRAELVMGTAIWAPNSTVTTNVIYQRIRFPNVVDTAGLGISIGRNVGGSNSGVNAWGRLSLEALYFAQRLENAAGESDWRWQARVGATLRGRISDGAFTTLNMGPRFRGDGSGQVDLVSTVGISYDVDQLFGTASVPMPLGDVVER